MPEKENENQSPQETAEYRVENILGLLRQARFDEVEIPDTAGNLLEIHFQRKV